MCYWCETRKACLSCGKPLQVEKPTSSCMVDSVVGFSPVFWEHEDELPEMSDDDFGAIFPESRLTSGTIGVRVYPYVKDAHGNKIFISKPNTH